MGPRAYFIAAGCLALGAVAGGAVWLTSGHGHGPVRVVRAAEPPVRSSTRPSPHPGKRTHAAAKGPLSTTAPHGAGLGAPDHLTGQPRYGTVTLRWYAVSRAAGYVIFRDGQDVGQTTGLLFDDTGLRNGQPHTWTVAAVDAAGARGDRSAPYVGAARAR